MRLSSPINVACVFVKVGFLLHFTGVCECVLVEFHGKSGLFDVRGLTLIAMGEKFDGGHFPKATFG